MSRSRRRDGSPNHPEAAEVDVLDVLHALSDPTRVAIVQILRSEPERSCGTFPVDVTPATLTHHFRVLREAGVIRHRQDGTRRWTSLRRADLEARFPGLLDRIADTFERSRPGKSAAGRR